MTTEIWRQEFFYIQFFNLTFQKSWKLLVQYLQVVSLVEGSLFLQRGIMSTSFNFSGKILVETIFIKDPLKMEHISLYRFFKKSVRYRYQSKPF